MTIFEDEGILRFSIVQKISLKRTYVPTGSLYSIVFYKVMPEFSADNFVDLGTVKGEISNLAVSPNFGYHFFFNKNYYLKRDITGGRSKKSYRNGNIQKLTISTVKCLIRGTLVSK